MSQTAIDSATVEQLRSDISGSVIGPGDPPYEEARRVWNGRIDRRPALIVSCNSTDDVVAAVRFGRDTGRLIAVRGGAHSTPGYSTCDDGIVIDLQPMNAVEVDPEARTARVQGGALWADLDAATQEHGLAVTGGRVSDTGVGGLSLGSGSGWLERHVRGHLREPALGRGRDRRRHASSRPAPTRTPTCSGGCAGGGGNFGVVTEFEFRLHPVGPIVIGGMLVFPRAQAREVLRAYRDFMAQAPDQVCGGSGADHGAARGLRPRGVCAASRRSGIVYCYVGPPEEGEEALRPLREARRDPSLDMVQPMPYAALQQMIDAGNPHGIREYFKIDWLRELPDDAIDVILEHAERTCRRRSASSSSPRWAARSPAPTTARSR